MSNCAFFYVDGIPTKGVWIDIDGTTDSDDVLAALAEANLIPRNEDGEPEYGGDLLVADIEGDLARAFYESRHDTLNLDGLVEAIDYCEEHYTDEAAVAAYIDDRGQWDRSDFEDAYCGEYDSEVAYAEALVDDVGYLSEMPESLRCYFDYEKFARDLFITDYYFSNGYVFRRS